MSIPIIGNPLGYFDDPIEHTLGVMAELGYDQLEICHCQIPEFPTSALRQQLKAAQEDARKSHRGLVVVQL